VELHQLRYLRAVVRAGGVTRAAEVEHVAQPSISKQIRLLERELGVPLFHRVGRRVVPTEAGLRLADCAGRVFEELAATTAAIAGPGAAAGASIRMCATETAADHLLPRALTELRERRPGLRVSVEMLGTDDAVTRLVDDDVDLAVVVLPLADSRLEIHSLIEEDVLLAVAPGHAWATRRTVPISEALGDPGLLLSMPGHGLRAQVDAAAQSLGIALPAAIEMRSQQALLAMVSAGGGMAFAPRMSLEGRDDVVALELDPPMRRQLGWARRRGRHLPAIAEELVTLLGER
jgi:LysR family cyn operon transcriptional activator